MVGWMSSPALATFSSANNVWGVLILVVVVVGCSDAAACGDCSCIGDDAAVGGSDCCASLRTAQRRDDDVFYLMGANSTG